MNIYLMLILIAMMKDAAILPTGRGSLRSARERAIAHNRNVYNDRCGRGKWFDKPYHDESHFRTHHPEWDGLYVPYPYKEGYAYNKPQNGRWATEKLSGHRRLQKWSRDYYPSFVDEKSRKRCTEALKDYFE